MVGTSICSARGFIIVTSKKIFDVKALIILVLCALVVMLAYGLVIKTSVLDKSSAQSASLVSQKTIQWKLVTSWPKHFPGLGTAPEVFAENVNAMSGGRLHIKVYGAGEIVPALGVFDAVSNGSVEMGHSGAYFWKGKTTAAVFFTTIPFGMTAQEMNAWLYEGGGLELWEEVYAPFGIKPLAGGNSGVQMAGWFNKEINRIEDIQGLVMRIPGVAGEVFSRLGGQSVTIAGGELYTSLKTGVIDAVEWVGPYNDLAMGFHEVAKYYYYPGWHEPGSTIEMMVNQKAFDRLPKDLQVIVEVAAKAANQSMLDEYTAKNNAALKELVETHGVEFRRLPDEVLIRLHQETDSVIEEMIADDPLAQKVYASYSAFAKDVHDYHQVSEKALLEARDLPIQ
ncbi:MAG: TRAP transporter substrate-binding protein DctP [Sinobacterium sp.]|nr:TRAP transporter substrate-binding protein DctP [Sinobacterium sp.]